MGSTAIIKSNSVSGSSSPSIPGDSPARQGAVVVRATSPSKIPIVPMNSLPLIKGGYHARDGDAPTIGGTGISHRVKNAVGADINSKNRVKRGGG